MGRDLKQAPAKDNAAIRAVFDTEHGKPVSDVLPVVRRRLAKSAIPFTEEMLTFIAEGISEDLVPTLKRDSHGSITLTKGE